MEGSQRRSTGCLDPHDPLRSDWIHRVYRALPRPPSTNLATGQLQYDILQDLPSQAVVLDVGAKDDRGRRSLREGVRYVTLDLFPGPGVDLVADAHSLPVRSSSIDRVICSSVLMYCADPKKAISEMHRILKPGGMVYISVAFVYRLAADPFDYFRISSDGLLILCDQFEPVQSGFNRGPASTIADMLTYFCAIVCCFNRKWLYHILVDVFQWCFWPLKYLDRVLNHYSMAGVIHSGAFFLGRKGSPSREGPVSAAFQPQR